MNARYAAQIRAGITLARHHVARGIEYRTRGLHREWVSEHMLRELARKSLTGWGRRAYRHTLNHGAAK